jgi:3-methyladenine DNA glycosylase AlkD
VRVRIPAEDHVVNAHQATELGNHLAALVQISEIEQAYHNLAPVLGQRTPFRFLDRIGGAVGSGALATVNAFLERIAGEKTEGGWAVIGSALGQQLGRDPGGAFARCRAFIVAADVWYGADILGERVPGPALVADFDRFLVRLAPWRDDSNRWVRRAVGVAAHFWAKRSSGEAELLPRAAALLAFLEPMFEEWTMDAVKGVGWGLKTLGKYYPGLMIDWLPLQAGRRHRSLMLRKAMTYLTEDQRAQATGGGSQETGT